MSTATRTILASVMVVFASLAFAASPASAAYERTHADAFNFTTSNSAVRASGHVQWYKDGTIAPVYRGQYTGSVKLTRSGCLHAQVQWKTVSGTVSWPPSGSSSTTSTGYYRKCGAAGTTLSLNGIAYSSRTLYRSCINLGYSTSATAARSYNSNHCMFN